LAQRKTSLITTAEKYVAKGQYKRAISSYVKLAKLEPDNIRTQLKLGELYIKSGSMSLAKATLLNTTQHYEESGMVLKAIAVYNQILQIDPGDPETRLALANAYKRIGLANDAAFQYGIAIKGFERQKDIHRKLDTIRTLLELDPENLTTRLRLGEEFSRHGMIDEAAEQFQSTCDSLLEKGLVDEFAQVAERLLFHKPDAFDVSKLLARYYLTKDYPQRALPLLHTCYKKHNQDVEVMNLLSHAFQRLGQVHKSVVVLGQLADFYAKSGLAQEEGEVKDRIIALDPEHPLAKKAKVEEVVEGDESLPSLEATEEDEAEEASLTMPPTPEVPKPPTSSAIPEKKEPAPVEVTAIPTQEFEVKKPEEPVPPPMVVRPQPAEISPPPAPRSLHVASTPEGVPQEEEPSQNITDAAPTIVFESPPLHPKSIEEGQNPETLAGDNGLTLEFDMSAAARTAPPISKDSIPKSDPRAEQMGPIQSTIVTSNSVLHQDELVTSEFEISDSQLQALSNAEQDGNWDGDKTLMDQQIPDIQMEPEFEIQMVESPTPDEVQQGELLEFDFFLEAGLLNDAESVLEELRKLYGDHPEVMSRQALLESLQKKDQ